MLMLYLDQERLLPDTSTVMSTDTCAFIINYFLHCIGDGETRELGRVRRDLIELRKDKEEISYSG